MKSNLINELNSLIEREVNRRINNEDKYKEILADVLQTIKAEYEKSRDEMENYKREGFPALALMTEGTVLGLADLIIALNTFALPEDMAIDI